MLAVTRDASRLADLLDEFMAQYSEDPTLKAKFLAFMAAAADTQYSVVDNKLSWVLWLYSLIWMPLLVVMCLTRSSSASAGSKARAQAAQQAGLQAHAGGASSRVPVSAPHLATVGSGGSGGAPGGGLPGGSGDFSALGAAAAGGGGSSLTSRRRVASASNSLDGLPPRFSVPGSFGRPPAGQDGFDAYDGAASMRSAVTTGSRSLRRVVSSSMAHAGGGSAAGGGGPHGSPKKASSERVHMSRPSKLHAAAASSGLPPARSGSLGAAAWGGGGGGPGSSSGSSLRGTSMARQAMAAGRDAGLGNAIDQAAAAAAVAAQQQQRQQHQGSMRPLKGVGAAKHWQQQAAAAAGDHLGAAD